MPGLIVLLCRNTLAYTRECLKTLLVQTLPVDVLAVDNASGDGTGKFLVSQGALHPNLYRMTNPQVESVARCWNQALEWAWSRGCQEALVCNSDVELLPTTYEKLVSPLHAWNRGLLSGVGVDRAPVHAESHTVSTHPDYSCYMITRWAHQRVPFDEGYEGAYFEDCDHHIRLFRAGIWAGAYSLEFLHHRSSTLRLADPAERGRIARCYDRNKLRFLRLYGTVPWTQAYDRLFLPASLPANASATLGSAVQDDGRGADAKGAEQPEAQHQDHHYRDDGLNGRGHGDVSLDQPEDHSDNH